MICTCTQRRSMPNGSKAYFARAYAAGRLVAETSQGRISEKLALKDLGSIVGSTLGQNCLRVEQKS